MNAVMEKAIVAPGVRIVNRLKQEVRFGVIALHQKDMAVIIKVNGQEQEFPLVAEEPSFFAGTFNIKEAFREEKLDFTESPLLYKFKFGGEAYPDPYSNYQPNGVNGFSQLIDQEKYQWHDHGWTGLELADFIMMEIHVGTFSPSGTFFGVQEKLNYLRNLGITAIELMPVNQTPGRWNWGYDGTGLFTVNYNYGIPDQLKELIDNCHQLGLAVILDVVYNHFGPEGNYLPAFGPYFTGKHKTPWGPAVNYDDDYSSYTRQMILDNVRYWLENYHLDALRLDAVQTIKDENPVHILEEIKVTAKSIAEKEKRRIYIIAETDQNNVKLINPIQQGGYGLDAQWMDDFHHCIHTTLTGEHEGYYQDYGRLTDLKKVYHNYLYTGEYSKYWGKERGSDAGENPGRQFVVAIQNHDQVGNRARGERLTTLVDFPYLKIAAGLMLYSAYLPLLFMGEEYGEANPFLFFSDYQEPALQKAVSQGRKEEFSHFTWNDVLDPQSESTFYHSKLTSPADWKKQNYQLYNFYHDLLSLRKNHPILKNLDKKTLAVEVVVDKNLVKIDRWKGQDYLIAFFNLDREKLTIEKIPGRNIFDSENPLYGGRKIEYEDKHYSKEKGFVLLGGELVIFETANQ